MKISFTDPVWDGIDIPEAHRCETPGAKSPGLLVANLPANANTVSLEFNDIDFKPLSKNGGHGILGYRFQLGVAEVIVPPVREVEEDDLPENIIIVSHNRGQSKKGYRAPCGGIGKFHNYELIVKAYHSIEPEYTLDEEIIALGKLKQEE